MFHTIESKRAKAEATKQYCTEKKRYIKNSNHRKAHDNSGNKHMLDILQSHLLYIVIAPTHLFTEAAIYINQTFIEKDERMYTGMPKSGSIQQDKT